MALDGVVDEAVFAAFLGLILAIVDVGEQFVAGCRKGFKGCGADAEGDIAVELAHGGGEFGLDAGDGELATLAIGGGHDDREFVASDACDDIGGAGAALQHAGDGAEDGVALGVPEAVVDLLEVVAVDERGGDGFVLALCGGDDAFGLQAEIAVIGEAGQAIGASMASVLADEIAEARRDFGHEDVGDDAGDERPDNKAGARVEGERAERFGEIAECGDDGVGVGDGAATEAADQKDRREGEAAERDERAEFDVERDDRREDEKGEREDVEPAAALEPARSVFDIGLCPEAEHRIGYRPCWWRDLSGHVEVERPKAVIFSVRDASGPSAACGRRLRRVSSIARR